MAKARDYSSEQLRRVQARRDPAQTARTQTRMQLAAKISEAMRANKVSKSQLAAQLDQQPSVVTKWLSGTHNFTVDTLTDIGRVLGVRLFNLIDETNGLPNAQMSNATYQSLVTMVGKTIVQEESTNYATTVPPVADKL